MSLDPATVRRIAKLARIHVADEELDALAGELGGIFGWVEQLNEVDVSGVEPLSGAGTVRMAESIRRLREDVVTEDGQREAVLANAPDRAGAFFAVPKVVE